LALGRHGGDISYFAADRGYFDAEEILACVEAGISVTLPKSMTQRRKTVEHPFGTVKAKLSAATLYFELVRTGRITFLTTYSPI
jgi:hypothetical protein